MTVSYQIDADKPTQDTLLEALRRYCQCGYNSAGALVAPCPGHKALVAGDRWIIRLLFERHEAARLVAEEWCQSEPVRAAEPEPAPPTPTPTTGLCSCGHWDSLHYGWSDRQAGCFAPVIAPGQLLCRCSVFTAQNTPAGDGLVRVRYGNGWAFMRRET